VPARDTAWRRLYAAWIADSIRTTNEPPAGPRLRVGAAAFSCVLVAALSATAAWAWPGAAAPRATAVPVPAAGAGAAARLAAVGRQLAPSASLRPAVPLLRELTAGRRPAPVTTPLAGGEATPCGETAGLLCSQVVVPLDRSGATPGTVTLQVQVLPASGTPRGAMFLIAGGPGQGSATVFGLGDPSAADYYRFLFPGYTLVAFDNRGTGGSALLNCPGLQVYYPIEQEAARVAACAGTIGPNRVFFSTREHAEDIEAVRQTLGPEAARIGLWGTSYGTKLAVAYALAHPGNVERLLLDSVVPTDLDDPYRANSLREMPASLRDYCSGGACRAATPDFAADVVAVSNRLAARPVTGRVLQPNGRFQTVRVTGLDVLVVAVDADLNPGLAAELPAVMRAARQSDYQPLLRMFALDAVNSAYPAQSLSGGLFAATVCNDGPFPWGVDAPVAGRRATFDAGVAALPAGALGPFGKWAAQMGNGHFCLGWPPPSGGVPLASNPLPNVPVLAVNGGFDMRTPVASARAVASRFPQGRVLVLPGVGHSVLGADPSFCSARATRSWILGEAFGDCARPPFLIRPISAYPAAKRTTRATPRQTLQLVRKTIEEAQAVWVMSGGTVAGLYGGRLTANDSGFVLTRYSITPGVEVSGRVRFVDFGPPLVFDGLVEVTGRFAATGLVGLQGGRLSGTLGGVLVG
jgi:pimeloyl-ACP methyl ester carboxylesterase